MEQKIKEKADVITKLLKRPKPNKGIYKTKYDKGYDKDLLHQADILMVYEDKSNEKRKTDNGYKYILVVVDGGTRLVDAEPLKKKESTEVKKALETIYKRGILKMPKNLHIDAGTEFKGTNGVIAYVKKHGTYVKTGVPGRHQQQALVENKNRIIGKMLYKRMYQESAITGEDTYDWVWYLPQVIKKINEKTIASMPTEEQIQKENEKRINDVEPPKYKQELLPIGSKVRVALHTPIQYPHGDKLGEKFRATDIRFHPYPREIADIILSKENPPLYVVYKIDKVGNTIKERDKIYYTRNELQPVDDEFDEEDYGDAEEIIKPSKLKNKEAYVGQKILDEKIIDYPERKHKYLIKFRGFKEPVWVAKETFFPSSTNSEKDSHPWYKRLLDEFEKRKKKDDNGDEKKGDK